MRYIAAVMDSGPLAFRSGRESTSAETKPYISGSALLGALGTAHARYRNDAAQFEAFFCDDSSTFCNLYPASFVPKGLGGKAEPVYPLPATAVTCKRFGGFIEDAEDPDRDPNHGVYDALIAWALFELSGRSAVAALASVHRCAAAGCDEPLDGIDGFYRRSRSGASVGKSKVARSLRTGTGIARATSTVAVHALYNRESLNPGMHFAGALTVADAQADAFYEFVQEINAAEALRLGKGVTRGFGRASLQLEEDEQQDTAAAMLQRIRTFDAELRAQAQAAGIAAPHAAYVPLTLTSDAILLDQLLRCRRSIEPAYLAEACGVKDGQLIYSASSTRTIAGWRNVLRMPKADDVAVEMGSVFLFGFAEPIGDETVGGLLRMQEHGIGVRRREGYGQVMVASPFHYEVKGS